MNNTPSCLLIFTFCYFIFFLLNVYTAASSPFHSMIFTFVCLDFVQTPKVIIVRLIGSWPVEQQELLSQTNTHNHNLISYETLGKTEKKNPLILYWQDPLFILLFIRVHRHHFRSLFFWRCIRGKKTKKNKKQKRGHSWGITKLGRYLTLRTSSF